MENFKIKEIVEKIKRLGAKRIFLQVPEGLKLKVLSFAEELEKRGFEVFISIETCYGACDLRDYEAKKLNCDLILHFGHSKMDLIPVIWEEYRIDFNPKNLLERNLTKLKKYKKIGLVTTVQFISSLEKAKKFLEARGLKIFIGRPKGKCIYPGQVLGCDYSSAKSIENKVNCFLFLGSGLFHPLGLVLKVKKPVLFLDFEKGELIDLLEQKEKRKRIKFAQIEKAKECER